MCEEKKPHVHAALIKAWADGAEIQVFVIDRKEWRTVHSPLWDATVDYRIKPEKKTAGEILYNLMGYRAWDEATAHVKGHWERSANTLIQEFKLHDCI